MILFIDQIYMSQKFIVFSNCYEYNLSSSKFIFIVQLFSSLTDVAVFGKLNWGDKTGFISFKIGLTLNFMFLFYWKTISIKEQEIER